MEERGSGVGNLGHSKAINTFQIPAILWLVSLLAQHSFTQSKRRTLPQELVEMLTSSGFPHACSSLLENSSFQDS